VAGGALGNQVALELGQDCQHLKHHLACCRGGVDLLSTELTMSAFFLATVSPMEGILG
jgi:hypothetical protein